MRIAHTSLTLLALIALTACCELTAAPAPLRRHVPITPITARDIRGEWDHITAGEYGWTQFYPDGTTEGQWGGSYWRGTWRLTGNLVIVNEHAPSDNKSIEWSFVPSRRGKNIVGDNWHLRKR